MEMGLASLSAQAVGTNHAVGQLSEGLLLFGGGEAAVIGIVGGITAIALAYESLTKDSRDAQKATEDLEKALDKFGEHGKIISLQIQAGAIQQHIEDIQDIRRRWGLDQDFGPLGGVKEAGARLLGVGESDIIKLQSDLAGVTDELGHMQQHLAGQEMQKAAREAEHYHEALVKLGNQFEALLDPVVRFFDAFDKGATAPDTTLHNVNDFMSFFQDLLPAIESVNKQISEAQAKAEQQAKEWGKKIAHALVEGITGNLNSLGDLLKSIVEMWLEKYLIAPFLLKLKIFSPSGFGQYVGEMLTAGIAQGVTGSRGVQGVGDMRLALNVNVGGSSPDPFSAARDDAWQRAYRETALVAHSNGFRLPT